ncbi:3753_t:CDS:2 [Acaulospora morrowiae]|uniref:3753_t:CDS:1 n=1 Tax=Acaulospora morrowiae TaxID=94023 RepID=A0A9N8W3B1_9GLOM|nr:3753_t:CDS:2 [Acaulospora morrowiae]
MADPLIIPELLENIFSVLAKDKVLYPALFVNRLWYYCSAPILWRHIEFSIEGYRRNRCNKNIFGPLYWQLRKFKRVICEKTKPLYCSKMVYLKMAGLKISDALLNSNISSASVIEIARSCPNLVYLNLNGQPSINDESICAIARSCVNLQHLDLSFNEIITDEAICAIATGCPDMRNYFLEDCEWITNKSIKKTAQLNRNLQKLILTSCYKITDDAVFLNAKKCPFISDESIYYLLSKKPALELILDWVP